MVANAEVIEEGAAVSLPITRLNRHVENAPGSRRDDEPTCKVPFAEFLASQVVAWMQELRCH